MVAVGCPAPNCVGVREGVAVASVPLVFVRVGVMVAEMVSVGVADRVTLAVGLAGIGVRVDVADGGIGVSVRVGVALIVDVGVEDRVAVALTVCVGD